MTKYIKVDWPDSQKFSDNEKCYIAIPVNREDYETSGNTYMVPEELYNEVMYELQFPKKYENTNLGTIVLYKTKAVVNGVETFWYDADDLHRGDLVLVYKYETKEWVISKCVACPLNLTILLEDQSLFIGLNCKFIGHYNPERLF